MTEQLQPPPPDLRTQFFPAPPGAPWPERNPTRLIDADPARDNAPWTGGPYLVQCNCACK